jgi:hypothetical protein
VSICRVENLTASLSDCVWRTAKQQIVLIR